jgi:hypothetical protein
LTGPPVVTTHVTGTPVTALGDRVDSTNRPSSAAFGQRAIVKRDRGRGDEQRIVDVQNRQMAARPLRDGLGITQGDPRVLREIDGTENGAKLEGSRARGVRPRRRVLHNQRRQQSVDGLHLDLVAAFCGSSRGLVETT